VTVEFEKHQKISMDSV